MKKTIHKIFPVWDFDKEEKWLNDMSAKGLHLCSVGFLTYVFEEGTPGEYIHRLEMLDNMPGHAKSADYINFIEDTGAEQIGSIFRWVYFRKKADSGGFDLFSDIESRIKHLNRILWLAGILSAMNLINGINTLCLWLSSQRQTTFVIPIICLAVGLLIGYGFLHVFIKKRKLLKERLIRE